MQDIIQLLPDSIANQIAAGEVVQRPASVIKELLENSIDAQAKSIQVIIKEAGKVLIQVIDDGIGMSETDARMSFERHATSKIRTADDLFRIRTMGFRGEALASIAAVAQVEMRTRRSADELGILLRIEGSELKQQETVAANSGTNIQVKNLFFNVPARRNFLKSNPVEMRHILDEFQRVSLAHPEVTFTLHHNDLEVYNLPAGKLSRRIVDLFGKNYREQLGACQEDTPYVAISGYIGKPSSAKKTRGEQFFFVNNRYIRHNYLHHAVLSAFEGLIAENTHPFYVLFLEIDPAHIDINVHPTKTEIKFDDERSVYAIVQAAVRKVMNSYNLPPTIDFDADVNFIPSSFTFTSPKTESSSTSDFNFSQEKTPLEKSNLTSWSKLYEGLGSDFEKPVKTTPQESFPFDFEEVFQPEQSSITFQSKANQLATKIEPDFWEDTERTTFQIHNRYVISPVKSGMLIIDKKAAYERILYDKYIHVLEKHNGASQQLLFPKTIVFNPVDFQLVLEVQEEIRALGFMFTEIGHNTILVQGIPADVHDENEQNLFEGLIEQFKLFSHELKLDRRENLARSFAKRSAARYTTPLSIPEMNMLVDQLFASSNPNFTPSGEPTLSILSLEKIAGLFK
ncbi:MAG: DNA mismatch repair endonuclease MutL [Spirosomataceae bacterium]